MNKTFALLDAGRLALPSVFVVRSRDHLSQQSRSHMGLLP